ncbi:MAG: bifunctional 4-hydroxy-2-oxoglutarate aldolase/2-dehydro-3-deoxy-phosphogluconate aldolase [Akkermansiaceae bacterium]|jgi:2-dehydro-3-deoxyphosphogluconate aldolase/(4S)-4-hydroxy-2-oxoglutarate aldolase|tara:strand:- start:6965 stop:7615 length:651 start_codon:yes stop_codon:yes gene_type:complete
MNTFPEELLSHLEKRGVVAGFSVEKIEHAVPLAKALLAGGIDVIELTLRTPIGLDAVKLIAAEVPEIVIGVGTILTPETAVAVKGAGAHFGVAPGMNPRVVKAAQKAGLPFAPGICTPSDLEAAIELGCRFVKFFPAEASGGLTYLKSMAAPYNHLGIRYFPLGGVNSENMLGYLAEDIVPTVGGTWIVAKDLVQNENWDGITAAAQKVINTLQQS